MSGQQINGSSKLITILDNRGKRQKCRYQFKLEADGEFQDLYLKLQEKLGGELFVLTFPDRLPVDATTFHNVTNGTTLWLLSDFDQKLKKTVGTPVLCQPHYHTITQSGMYEYYDSRGIDSLVISLAELIDNSLAATKVNEGLRYIEIRYYEIGNDSMVVILDNGHGMDFNGLHDWARFKYSKFERKKKRQTVQSSEEFEASVPDSGNFSFSSDDLPLRPNTSQPQIHIPDPKDRRPRYLDSEINYFGAGGKQAIFNIGEFTTMVSKTVKSEDVVELTLSTKKFATKAEVDQESVYRDEILTRTAREERKVEENAPISEHILNEVIAEKEKSYQSFTICAIKDVFEKHKPQFKKNNENNTYWSKGLARIYHYYLHGPSGNIKGRKPDLPPDLKDIRIVIKVFNVKQSNGGIESVPKHTINLKEIYDDFETLLVQSAADTFEFEVEHKDKPGVVIEGIIRYYPFLYDRETLPLMAANEELGETCSQVSAQTGFTENQIEEVLNPNPSKTKHREVFECFWHGRLIPQDLIDFEWTKFDPKNNNIKGYEECYDRLSGALFTNHAFHVSQNKQSFIDLNKLMAQKGSLDFYRVNASVRRRGKFETDFINWIKNCHNKYDKQVLYKKYQGDISRNEFPSLKKNSFTDTYSVFNAINWRDREWESGDKILTKNTKPQGLIGRINRFLVPKCIRDNSGNFMGSPGFVEIHQLPQEIYGKEVSKIIIFKQINVEVTDKRIEDLLDQLDDKLPDCLDVTFPEGNAIKSGDQIIVGTPIGGIKVIVKNSLGIRLTKDRIPYKTGKKKIFVQADIQKVLDDGEKDKNEVPEVIVAYDYAPFNIEHDYYFTEQKEGIKKVGKYKLVIGVVLSSTNAKDDKEMTFPDGLGLPIHDPIIFSIIAGPPKNFTITNQMVKTLVGKPFDLTLQFTDEFGNPAKPTTSLGPPVLSINGTFKMEFNSLEILEDRAVIKSILISGLVYENQNPILKISMPSINKEIQEIDVFLQRGLPSQIRLYSTKLEFINGEVPELGLLLFDSGGNEVTFDRKHPILCKILDSDTCVAVTPDILLIESMHNSKRVLSIGKEIVVKGTVTPFNSRKFSIRFFMKGYPQVVLQKELIIKKNSKPQRIRLFHTVGKNSEPSEIEDQGRYTFAANSLVSGVYFEAYDCDESRIDLSDFKDHIIYMNWHNKPHLIHANGGLPNIAVHTDSSSEITMTLTWTQVKKDINVEHTFYMRPHPDSPQTMDISTGQQPLVFPLGVVVKQPIEVSVLDAYKNVCSIDAQRLVIKPQKVVIDGNLLEVKCKDNLPNIPSFIISNIKLLPNPNRLSESTQNDSVIGTTSIEFSILGFDEISESIDITVVNGIPASLQWLSQHKCLTLMNNKRLEIRTQLLDAYNNPVIDNKLSVTLALDQDFDRNQLSAETDDNGVALFSETIHIKRTERPLPCVIPTDLNRDFHLKCTKDCFGFHKIQTITRFQQKVIKSCYHWLHIICDNTNPSFIDCRATGPTTVVSMSEDMPKFNVCLFAEDKSKVSDFDPNKVEMQLINSKDNNFQVFQPVPPFSDTFRFRVDRAPRPNLYRVKFVCYGVERFEKDFKDYINVIPDKPIKLMVKSEALKNCIIVTNVGDKRSVLESPLTLDLVDRNGISIYENIPNRELDANPLYRGTLTAKIVKDIDERIPVPHLEGCDENMCLRFPINRGKVVIKEDQLRLEENTRGSTSTRYLIQIETSLASDENRRHKIEPFHINIMFCDDTERQQQLNQIQDNISFHENQREDIQKELENKKKELREQEMKYNRIRLSEDNLMDKLKILKERSDLSDEQKIVKKLKEYEQKLNEINARQSDRIVRGQQISSAPQLEGVVGKIAHLAFIQDEDYARSISWLLRDHINGIVVKTSQFANELFEKNEFDSIISLEMISKRLPNFIACPPHKGPNGSQAFNFCQTVGVVRALLRFNENLLEVKDLEKLFTSLLKKTLFTSDLRYAKQYRKLYEEKIGDCPTIVAKDGILYDNGFVESVPNGDNFVCFQSPPDRDYNRVHKVFDILNDLIPIYKQRNEEFIKKERLTEEYKRLDAEKSQQISELNQSIGESRREFANVSQTQLEGLDEDSNESRCGRRSSEDTKRRRSSSESNKRRRSYDNRSNSKSGERKRSRL